MANILSNGIYVKTTVNDIYLPDAPFPPTYLPTNNFKVKSDMSGCQIPWLIPLDAFSAFELAGGISGTTQGSVTGLSVADTMIQINSREGNFSTFGTDIGPRFGYCIQNKFKQHVYIRFDVINDPARKTPILLYSGVELLENGRFNRIYVKEGEVSKYQAIANNESIISLGIDKTTPPPKDVTVGGVINVSNSAGKSVKLDIKSIRDNWDIVVTTPSSKDVPAIGDYYSLDETWCIYDPYQLTGYWVGTENQASQLSNEPTSGLNLYRTEQNSPYEEGYVTGVYIWQKKEATTTSATTTATPTTTTETVTLAPQPSAGTSMADTADYEWAFCGYGNSQQYSDTYPNDVRYKETTEVSNVAASNVGGSVITRPVATSNSVDSLLASNPMPEYLRIEIGKGGYYSRNNWQSPCLRSSYIDINGSKYKIKEQVEADIIDVSTTSIDGKKLSINGTTEYSILNQYAWTIVENYYEVPTGQRTGIMEGQVTSAKGKVVVLNIKSDPPITTGTKRGVSLKQRYQTNISLSNTLVKLFNKQDNWRLLDSGSDGQYFIDTVTYDTPNADGSYKINITLKEESSIGVGKMMWLVFGEPYATLTGNRNYLKKNGYLFKLTVAGGLSGNNISPFIVSDVLCVDGYYDSNPYKVDIRGNNIRVGVCDGLEFGVDANGSLSDRMGVFMFIKAAGFGRGIGSFFHALRHEGWIAYQDLDTGKITIRKGLLDFKESPVKSEVAIGKPILVETASVNGSTISLNSNKERLRRLSIKVPTSSSASQSAIMFNIGDNENFYGFLISGDGLVDLQMLRYQGIGEGVVPSTRYLDSSGLPVSPFYVYTKSVLQDTEYVDVDMGIETDSVVDVRNADSTGTTPFSIDDARAYYINNNQVIENKGYFDIIRKTDGEVFLLYGQPTSSFRLGEQGLRNSDSNSTKWNSSNAVYIVGSNDDAYYWGTPTKLKAGGSINDNVYQYSIMLLNSVDYLSSIYNPNTNSICVFVRALYGEEYYVGCFSVSIQSLTHTLYPCIDEKYVSSDPASTPLQFFYRPTLIDNAFVTDRNKSWIDSNSDIIASEFNMEKLKDPYSPDTYIRVLGPGSTKSQIAHLGEFEMISTNVLSDGTYMLLYNSLSGVRAIFSTSQGQTWTDSNIIMARGANSGMVLGDYLFYITSDGIMVKHISASYFLNAIKKAGISDPNLEKQIQEQFDIAKTTLISGAVDIQRLSGYITPEQYYRVFFYDSGNRLQCVGSQDGLIWKTIDNF